MFEFEEDLGFNAKIKVVGVGGGGCNALQTMIREKIEGVDFVIMNTDLQALQIHEAMMKIQLGNQLTKGLGSGSDPAIGRDAAEEDTRTIQEALKGSDMIFITAGMGGGTGTGAAPVIARVAKEMGILTVGVVTKPFSFEGQRRMKQAEAGIKALKDEVDTLICIPNDNLLSLVGKDTPILDGFKMIDYVLLQAVRGISDLITTPGLINLDFADIKTIISDAGVALMGTGIASGENRAIEAAKLAITSPLLEDMSIAGATGILLNITGSNSMTLFEVNEASKLIQQECHQDVNIIFGTVVDHSMTDDIRVTVVATGFASKQMEEKAKTDTKKLSKNLSTKKWFDFPEQVEEPTPEPAAPSPEPQPVAPKPQPTPQATTQPQSPQPETLSIRDVFDDLSLETDEPVEQTPEEPAPSLGSDLFQSESLSLSPSGVVHRNTEVTPGWGENDTENSNQPIQRNQTEGKRKRVIPELNFKDHLDSDEYDIPAFIRKRAD